jgi:hypothetical protein
MDFIIRFSEEKNQLLKATRNVSFEEVIIHIKNGNLLADKKHQSPSRANQRLYVVQIDRYAYVVPYVVDVQRKEIFLKTIYPSRAFTRIYLKGD